jgi:large subunit ribosomal protein L33
MNKRKEVRSFIIIECIECRSNIIKPRLGVSRYITSKNKRNTSDKLDIAKHCKYCNKHTRHKEIK